VIAAVVLAVSSFALRRRFGPSVLLAVAKVLASRIPIEPWVEEDSVGARCGRERRIDRTVDRG
jgi:hypothetical protein